MPKGDVPVKRKNPLGPIFKGKSRNVDSDPTPGTMQFNMSCVMVLNKEQAAALCDLIESLKMQTELRPGTFDDTPLGQVLLALKSGGRVG